MSDRADNPWLSMFFMPVGDHRNLLRELRGEKREWALGYWTGSFWAFAPVTEDPKPIGFRPTAQRQHRAELCAHCRSPLDFAGMSSCETLICACGAGHAVPGDRGSGYVSSIPADNPSIEPEAVPIAYIAEPARRVIERIADSVTTMQREGSADFHKGCEAIAKECAPLFAQLGIIETGEGPGFDEDQFEDPASSGGTLNDTPQFRRLALIAASQASTATAELMQSGLEGPLHHRTLWNDEPIEKLADALKLAIEASIEAGQPLDEERDHLLYACRRFVAGWAG